MSGSDLTTIERALRESAPVAGDAAADAAASGLAARADEAGVLDVAWSTLDTPVGEMLVASTRRGLVRVGLPRESFDDVLEGLAARVSPRLLELPARTDEARRELEEYFAGDRRDFDLRLDWRLAGGGFSSRVLHNLRRIPYGEAITYAEAAAKAGNPRGSRAAGNACGSNPIPVVVPCHRVVRTGGAVGNYGGGPEMKRYLLDLEGWEG